VTRPKSFDYHIPTNSSGSSKSKVILTVLSSITCIKGIDPSRLKGFNPKRIVGGCSILRKNGNYFDLWNLYRLLKSHPRSRTWTTLGRSAKSLFIPIYKNRYDPDISRLSWIAKARQNPIEDEVITDSEDDEYSDE